MTQAIQTLRAKEKKAAARPSVVLVSMPWAPAAEPSLGLAILKASLQQNGISARVLHAAPMLLRWVSIDTYEFLADCWGVSEFLFTALLDPECDEGQLARLIERSEHYVSAGRHQRYPGVKPMCELFLKLRHEIMPQLLIECAERILESSPTLVGFTCMFDQTLASVVLAKLLKDRVPKLPIVLGGYALEGSPGVTVASSFPWIDAIVLGDGEEAIVELARAAREGKPLAAGCGQRSKLIRTDKIDMDTSPVPDYSDWFEGLAELQAMDHIQIRKRVLPVESSRGCWWGQVKHCVFCGIDEETLKYRHKSPAKTLEMLRELRERYGEVVFRFSDYIMPKRYYKELLPLLARQDRKFQLQGEIKANHPPDRVQQFAEAGFRELQPGIESFSTKVLRSMDKGVRAIDNVSLLKAGYINRLIIDYNLLYGLPDDSAEDYLLMARRIPQIYHLMPPISRNETVVTRFAPLQANPGRFGIATNARHHPCYDVIFSREYLSGSGFSLDDYAYYFDRNFPYQPELETLYSQIVQQVNHWKAQHRERFVELSYAPAANGLAITDSRFAAEDQYELTGPLAAVYRACDAGPTSVDRLMARLSSEGTLTAAQVADALAELEERRIVWAEEKHVLGLAVPKCVADAHRKAQWPQQWMSLFV